MGTQTNGDHLISAVTLNLSMFKLVADKCVPNPPPALLGRLIVRIEGVGQVDQRCIGIHVHRKLDDGGYRSRLTRTIGRKASGFEAFESPDQCHPHTNHKKKNGWDRNDWLNETTQTRFFHGTIRCY